MCYILIFILLFGVGFSSTATTVNPPTDITVNCLNTDNGLSHNTINSIYIDEFGLVWIATGDGLNRFDGKTAELIKTPSNIITGVCGDRNGHLFIKGHHTLYRMDLATFEVSTICTQDVGCMAYADGMLFWSSGGKILRDGTEVFNLNDDGGIILDIAIDKNQNIFVATSRGEIIRVSGNSRIVHYALPGVLFLDTSTDGFTWACSRTDGILRIDLEGNTENYKVEGSNDMDENNVRSVVQKNAGEYYVGTYQGLFLLDTHTNTYTPLSFQPGLNDFHSQAVRALEYDGKTLFIGTYHAGLHYHNDIHNIRTIPDLSSPVVSAIEEDNDGNIWIGTVSGGLTIIDKKTPLPKSFKNAILSDTRLNNIKYILFDEFSNSIWVALFSEGIFRIDLNRHKLEKIPIPFYSENITKLQLVEKSKILCYCIDGLFTIQTNTLKIEPILGFPFKSEQIIDFQVDGNNIWATGMNAVYKIESLDNPSNYIRYPLNCFPGIRDENSIITIFKSNSGRLLFCTNGSGIYGYDSSSDTFKHELKDNIYVNNIHQKKGSDTILASTNNGLLLIDERSWQTTYLNKLNGFPFSTVNTSFETGDSTILVCGTNTMYVLDKKSSFELSEDYTLHIKSAYAEGEELSPSPLFCNEIKLKGPVKSLSFDIVNNSLETSRETSFEYCLKGLDSEYSQAFSSMITYTNIQPGKYTLLIRGTLKTTSGEHPSIELPITITPPFFKTKLFYIILTLISLLLLAMILFSIERTNRLKMELKIEKHDEELFRKFSNDKSAFISTFTSQFKSPLAVVNSNIEALLRKEKATSEQRSNLQDAYRNLEFLNNLVEKLSKKTDFIGEDSPLENSEEKILKTAIEIIEKNISNKNFDISEFASALCMSRTLLFNKIKELTGLTPNAFILSIKLRKAAAEIENNPGETTSSIAYRCGFETPSYFIKCFKRYFGMTPLEFKKSLPVSENSIPKISD